MKKKYVMIECHELNDTTHMPSRARSHMVNVVVMYIWNNVHWYVLP